METSSYSFTEAQKESCAVNAMRDAAQALCAREGIAYEDALLRFAGSRIYGALFDFETEIWRESPEYLLNLYDYCNSRDK